MSKPGKLHAISLKPGVVSYKHSTASGKQKTTSGNKEVHGLKLLTRSLQLIACSFLLFASASAQQVSATIDRDKILLGEQVTLQLKAENIQTQSRSAWQI